MNRISAFLRSPWRIPPLLSPGLATLALALVVGCSSPSGSGVGELEVVASIIATVEQTDAGSCSYSPDALDRCISGFTVEWSMTNNGDKLLQPYVRISPSLSAELENSFPNGVQLVWLGGSCDFSDLRPQESYTCTKEWGIEVYSGTYGLWVDVDFREPDIEPITLVAADELYNVRTEVELEFE